MLVNDENKTVAFDYSSVRNLDVDGKLHVATTNISKANVCPYYGVEIPGYKELGLEPSKMYRLYRDPDELRKAAPTFNHLPVLDIHEPFTVDKFDPTLIIGSTGTDANFTSPYLQNSMVLWTQEAIDEVQTGSRKELSCSYRYKPDMTPGFVNGEPYDGVMRDIVGNHVALVTKGRAGPDVVVGDAAMPDLKEIFMTGKIILSPKAAVTKGALLVLLRPKLAQDVQIDLTPVLKDITQVNFKDSIKAINDGVTEATKGKLAKDAKLDDVAPLLEQLAAMDEAEAPAMKPADDADKDDDEDEKKKKKAEDKKDDDEKDDKKKADDKKAMDNMVTKEVMATAISTAVSTAVKNEQSRQQSLREAYTAVRPYIGELAVACDSADAVYIHTLKALGMKDVEKIHASAYPALLAAQPLPKRRGPTVELSADGAVVGTFNELFPDAAKIGRA